MLRLPRRVGASAHARFPRLPRIVTPVDPLACRASPELLDVVTHAGSPRFAVRRRVLCRLGRRRRREKASNGNSRIITHETRFASDFLRRRFAFAFAAGAAFPLVVWSPGIVSHAAYRALLDGGLKRTGAFLKLGVPFGAVTRRHRVRAGSRRKTVTRRDGYLPRAKKGVCVSFARAGAYLARHRGACGFLLVATSAPWLDARGLCWRPQAPARLPSGRRVSECAFAYGGGGGGGGGGDDAPALRRPRRLRRRRRPASRRVGRDGAARFSRRARGVARGPDATVNDRIVRVDDGVGGFAPAENRAFSARLGWSSRRSVPSGRFLIRRVFRSIFRRTETPFRVGLRTRRHVCVLAPTFASGCTCSRWPRHRPRLSARRRRAGRLSSRRRPGAGVPTDCSDGFESGRSDLSSSLRHIAAAVARPPVAVRVPRGCARTSWSPFAAPAQRPAFCRRTRTARRIRARFASACRTSVGGDDRGWAGARGGRDVAMDPHGAAGGLRTRGGTERAERAEAMLINRRPLC